MNINLISEIKSYIKANRPKNPLKPAKLHTPAPPEFKEAKKLSKITDEIHYETIAAAEVEFDIDEYIGQNKNNPTFSEKILKIIDESGKTDVEVYKKAGIDRRVFSKLRSSRDYRPSRQTAISLCIALCLCRTDFDGLLSLAGYSLSNTDTFDLIIMFFIEKSVYNIPEINEALDYFGCKPIGCD